MSRYRRWNELLELLAADGRLPVASAAQVLGVSAATVRRGFDKLARPQMLMAGRVDQVVISAGNSKVGRRAFARICAAAEVDIVVTDTDAGIAPNAKLADAGVRVVTA